MTSMTWLSILPPLLTIAVAIWSRRTIPSLLVGLLLGGYLLDWRITGGFETAVDRIVSTLRIRTAFRFCCSSICSAV